MKGIQKEYFYEDRPPTPTFRPPSPKHDMATQIIQDDKALFDFDSNAEPILEVLIARCIEEGQVEIFEETRAAKLKKMKKIYEIRRRGRLTTLQCMEFKRRRILKEEEERKRERQRFLIQDLERQKKVICREKAKSRCGARFVDRVFERMRAKRVLRNEESVGLGIFMEKMKGIAEKKVNIENKEKGLVKILFGEARCLLAALHQRTMLKKVEREREIEEELARKAEEERRIQEQKEATAKRQAKREEGAKIKQQFWESFSKSRTLQSVRESKRCRALYMWTLEPQIDPKERAKNYHSELFGAGLSSLILLNIYLESNKPEILSVHSNALLQIDEPQKSSKRSSRSNSRTSMNSFNAYEMSPEIQRFTSNFQKLLEKWGKSVKTIRFEVPVLESMSKFLSSYEQFIWTHLSLKEKILSDISSMHSEPFDMDAFEALVKMSLEPGITKIGVLEIIQYFGLLGAEEQRSLILRYYFNSFKDKVKPGPVKRVFDRLIKPDDFLRSTMFETVFKGLIHFDKHDLANHLGVENSAMNLNNIAGIDSPRVNTSIPITKIQSEGLLASSPEEDSEPKEISKPGNNQSPSKIPENSKGGLKEPTNIQTKTSESNPLPGSHPIPLVETEAPNSEEGNWVIAFLVKHRMISPEKWKEAVKILCITRLSLLKKSFSKLVKKYKKEISQKETDHSFDLSDASFPKRSDFAKPCFLQLKPSTSHFNTQTPKHFIRVNPPLSSKKRPLQMMKRKSTLIQSSQNSPSSLSVLTGHSGLMLLDSFKSFRRNALNIDIGCVTSEQIEKFEQERDFDGQTRFLKELVYAPLKTPIQNYSLWRRAQLRDVFLMNRINQRSILNKVFAGVDIDVEFDLEKWAASLGVLEDLFLESEVRAQAQVLIFDFEFSG